MILTRHILGICGIKQTDYLLMMKGKLSLPDCTEYGLKNFLEKANLKYETLHSLRHTNITLQLTSDVDLKTVSARAGHARASTTRDIYSHFIKNSDSHASKIIDYIFAENPKNITS